MPGGIRFVKRDDNLQRTLPEVLASGVGSVAVVRALVAAARPEAIAAKWRAVIDAAGAARPASPFQEFA